MIRDARTTEELQRQIGDLEDRIVDLQRQCEEHRQQAELLAVTLANISDPVFITDAAGAFTYVCPNVRVALGFTDKELLALGKVEAVLGGQLVQMDELKARGEVINIEHRVSDKAGHPRDLLINIKHISIGAGTALYVCRDITERKRTLERVRLLREELTHVSRVTTLGEFAAGLAHDLNQPLTAIANYAHGSKRTLQADRVDEKRLREILESIAAEAERAGTIVRRLRDLVRRDASSRQTADLNAVIRDVLDLVRHDVAQHGIELSLALTERPLYARIDKVLIQQVVLNLIRNSCDSITACRGEGGVIEIISHAKADEVELTIRDNGQGIAPEVAERLFEPFFTTKVDGMGMGLAIGRSIMEEHGGELRLGEPRGVGAQFSLVIPQAKDD
ncbi:MAG: sensor histidine kinase [Phycisphaerales bacterium JB038]